MPRVKRGNVRRAKRKKLLSRAKGFYQTKSKLYRSAKESVDTALKYAFVGRRRKKRDFRRLWVMRINAAARENGLTYGQLIAGLKAAGNPVDRKTLAELADHQPGGLRQVRRSGGRGTAGDREACGLDRGEGGAAQGARGGRRGARLVRRRSRVQGSVRPFLPDRQPPDTVRLRPRQGLGRRGPARRPRPLSVPQRRTGLGAPQGARHRAGRGASGARQARQPSQARHRSDPRRADRRGGTVAPAGRRRRRHPARPAGAARASPPADAAPRAHRSDLHRASASSSSRDPSSKTITTTSKRSTCRRSIPPATCRTRST